jgi:hypothetical protein
MEIETVAIVVCMIYIVITTGLNIKRYFKKRKLQKTNQQVIANEKVKLVINDMEEDFWFAISWVNGEDYTDSKEMMLARIGYYGWIHENIKGNFDMKEIIEHYQSSTSTGKQVAVMIKFDDDADAMAYKLRWGE